METMDRATFENYRSSFMFRKREKPSTLSSFALEVFDEIFREEYNFYRRCSELEALQSITLDDLTKFYFVRQSTPRWIIYGCNVAQYVR